MDERGDMTKKSTNGASFEQNLREKERREKNYREQALKLYPWICGRCAREFAGKNLRELTVHHKDHNHDNNPPDGSNWELLCIYCHDNGRPCPTCRCGEERNCYRRF